MTDRITVGADGFDFSTYESVYRQIRGDIFTWCKLLKFDPTDPHQIDIFQAYNAGIDRMSVTSGQGAGKTSAEVILGSHRAFAFPMSRGRVVATSMTQLLDTWMPELRLRIGAAPYEIQKMFEIRSRDVRLFGQQDWNIAMVTAARPENLQGRHNPNLWFIVDEASGVTRPMYEVIEGTLTQVHGTSFFGLFGNPNYRNCYFFDTHNKFRHLWWTYTINAEDSPIANPEVHRKLAEQYGKDSDIYRVRVLGLFPRSDPNTLFSIEDLLACTKTDMYEMMKINRGVRQYGIDFARMGSDESTIFRRSGNAIVEWKFFTKTEPLDVLAEAFAMQHRAAWPNESVLYVPDADGLGGGLMKHFYQDSRNCLEFHNGGTASQSQFADKITEAYFHLGALVRSGMCHLPNDDRLFEQLVERQYTITPKGKLKLEPKEQFRSRMLRNGSEYGRSSPDRADACAMAFYTNIGLTTENAYNQMEDFVSFAKSKHDKLYASLLDF